MNSGQLKELEALGELSGQLHQVRQRVWHSLLARTASTCDTSLTALCAVRHVDNPRPPPPIQTNDAVEALNAVVVTLNDRLRALEGHLGAINTPLQASMYDFVMAAQAATQKARSDSTNAAAFER